MTYAPPPPGQPQWPGQPPAPQPGRGVNQWVIIGGVIGGAFVLLCVTFGIIGALTPSSKPRTAASRGTATPSPSPTPTPSPSPSPSPSPRPSPPATRPAQAVKPPPAAGAKWILIKYAVRKEPEHVECVIIIGCGRVPDSYEGTLTVKNVGSRAASPAVSFVIMKGAEVLVTETASSTLEAAPGQLVSMPWSSSSDWQPGPYRMKLTPQPAATD